MFPSLYGKVGLIGTLAVPTRNVPPAFAVAVAALAVACAAAGAKVRAAITTAIAIPTARPGRSISPISPLWTGIPPPHVCTLASMADTEFERIRYELAAPGVGRITLARPDKANAQDL